MNDNVAFFSFVGMAFCGICCAIGFSVVGRAGWAAITMLWEKRGEIDERVEKDFKIRIER